MIEDWINEFGMQDTLEETATRISHSMANRGCLELDYEDLKHVIAKVLARDEEELPKPLHDDLVRLGYL